jgi:hypothetical protein
MKRLGLLNDYEKEIIMHAKEEEIEGIYPMSSSNPHILAGLDRYPDLVEFLDCLFRENKYRDIHSGNIMKDEDNSYRLVDLEGFIYTPFDRPENDWMRE